MVNIKKNWEPVQALDIHISLMYFLMCHSPRCSDDDTFMTSLNIKYLLNYTDKLLFEGY